MVDSKRLDLDPDPKFHFGSDSASVPDLGPKFYLGFTFNAIYGVAQTNLIFALFSPCDSLCKKTVKLKTS